MDEIELRIAALELYCLELGAWLDPEALNDAARSISGGLAGATDEERRVRRGALQLIEDAQRRYGGPELGLKR